MKIKMNLKKILMMMNLICNKNKNKKIIQIIIMKKNQKKNIKDKCI